MQHDADVQQAAVFHAFLAAQRAELCDLLDQQAANLELAGRHSYGAKVKQRRIREIGAEIREVDRMMHGLTTRLLLRTPPHAPHRLGVTSPGSAVSHRGRTPAHPTPQ
jgi:hypothetical protein